MEIHRVLASYHPNNTVSSVVEVYVTPNSLGDYLRSNCHHHTEGVNDTILELYEAVLKQMSLEKLSTYTRYDKSGWRVTVIKITVWTDE